MKSAFFLTFLLLLPHSAFSEAYLCIPDAAATVDHGDPRRIEIVIYIPQVYLYHSNLF